MNLSRDEAEELCFVPSALSVPRGPMFLCDNRCSDKAPRFWQFASVVVEEGEESYTTNWCQQCCNKHDQLVPAMLQQKSGGNRRQTLDEVAVVRGRGEEGASLNVVENAGERPVHTRYVGVFFL